MQSEGISFYFFANFLLYYVYQIRKGNFTIMGLDDLKNKGKDFVNENKDEAIDKGKKHLDENKDDYTEKGKEFAKDKFGNN